MPYKPTGRPAGNKPYVPTDAARKQVELAVGMGLRRPEIAALLGITDRTLFKYFKTELETGHPKAVMQMSTSLFRQGLNGNATAAIFWLKVRAGWRENIDISLGNREGETLRVTYGWQDEPAKKDEAGS